jgi:hypothetical protein
VKRGENLRRYDHTGPTYCTRPAEYRSWSGMLTRCRNPRSNDWMLYGGRGITVCEAWLAFEGFYADMGPKPSPRHSLDRIDGDGNYEPGNCRWATPKQQARNWKRRNVRYELNGDTRTEAEWCELLGISKNTLKERISNWGITRALTTPPIRTRERSEDGRYA